MKKIFLILFLMITLLPLVAYTYQTDSVIVKSTVSKITLSQAAATSDGMLCLYKLYGGLNSASDAELDSLVAEDVSESDIKVYFRIAQLAKTRTDETISISVEAGSLVNVDSDFLIAQDSKLVVSTPIPAISDISCLSMDCLNVVSSQTGNGIEFHLAYSSGRPVENINLAFFTVTWKKTEGLAPGEYTSNITMGYITN